MRPTARNRAVCHRQRRSQLPRHLVGPNADLWAPASAGKPPDPTFNRKGLLNITLDGPEQFKVRVPANSNIMICFVPGTYTMSSTAPGFKFKADTHSLEAGGCYWSVHYRENETPPEVNCSPNHAEYKRPAAFR